MRKIRSAEGGTAHHAEHFSALAFQLEHHIQVFVFKAYHGMLRIEHHGRKQGQNRFQKMNFTFCALPRGEFGGAQNSHSVFIELRFQARKCRRTFFI